ncbi:MAG TPA: sulfatase [Planctomycetota bacterium]|nr:sulfatase [Planctomycetota bacterium]
MLEPRSPPTAAAAPGLGSTLRAGLNAALLAGAAFGLLDGVVAGLRTGLTGVHPWLGSLGGAVAVYSLAWLVLMLPASLVLHPLLRRLPRGERLARLNVLALGLGVFFELYWWSRTAVLPGLSSTDPRRIGMGLVFLTAGLGAGWGLVALGRRTSRALQWTAAAAIPLLVLYGLAYISADTESERGRVHGRTRALPNVLLVVVDALRQDVLGCYGNERVQTPVMDGLAARGVRFDEAWVQAPFTWTSFGSILTGKHPRRHGLVSMVAGVRMAPNVTLPWHLKSARFVDGSGALEPDDYLGAAFMTGTLSHGSGLLRGFDVYYEAMVGHDLVDLERPWTLFRSELVVSRLWTKLRGKWWHSQNQDPVAVVASDWFAEHGRKRFVSMVHFYSTHTPYDPPPQFRAMYVDPDYDGPIGAFYSEYREAIEAGEYEPTPADAEQIRNLYYGGVTQADAMIGEILAELERQGVLDHTLVIVTSDHGEELGDHGLWEHNFMYETNLRVPLIMVLPGRLPAGVVSDALVETTDIVPTVCVLLGVEAPYEPDQIDELGRDRGSIDGHALVDLVHGRATAVREHAFAENGVYLAVRDARWKLVVAADALDADDWRTAPSAGVRAAELYDLERDPDEHANAIDAAPTEAERLLAVLRAWDAQLPVPRSDVVSSQRDIEAQANLIKSLGYSDGVGAVPVRPDEDGEDGEDGEKP